MSEIHVEHRSPDRMKESMNGSRNIFSTLKALFIDMIPVILGILVALSLNSVRETIKEHREERYFLERLRADLKEDLKELESDVYQYRKRKHAVAFLKKFSATTPADKDSAFYYFQMLPGQTGPNITNAAYITLLSGGKLGLIEDKSIVESLVLLYTDIVPGLVHTTDSFNEFKSSNINNVVFGDLDYGEIRRSHNLDEFLANRKVKNAFEILWFDEVIDRYNIAIAAHEKLISEIDRQL